MIEWLSNFIAGEIWQAILFLFIIGLFGFILKTILRHFGIMPLVQRLFNKVLIISSFFIIWLIRQEIGWLIFGIICILALLGDFELSKKNKKEKLTLKTQEKEMNEVIKITLLKKEQIWGFNALQIIKDYGRKASLTDLAIVLSGPILGKSSKTTSEGDRAGFIWTSSPFWDGTNVLTVDIYGKKWLKIPTARNNAVRPAIPPSETYTIHVEEEKLLTINNKKIMTVLYGEYPQVIASDNIQKILEDIFKNKELIRTGKNYTYDTKINNAPGFTPRKYPEYELDGKKYVRIEANEAVHCDKDSVLSNGKKFNLGDVYWIEVQPIEWLIDKSGWWIAKKALFTRIQFDRNGYYDGNFNETDMMYYLNNYFSREILPAHIYKQFMEDDNDGKEAQLIQENEEYKTIQKQFIEKYGDPSIVEELNKYIFLKRIAEMMSKNWVSTSTFSVLDDGIVMIDEIMDEFGSEERTVRIVKGFEIEGYLSINKWGNSYAISFDKNNKAKEMIEKYDKDENFINVYKSKK